MTRRLWVLFFVSLCVAAALQCGKDSANPGGPGGGGTADTTFAGGIQPIFTSSCATSSACHQAPGQYGLILSAGQSYALLVNVNSNEVPALKRVRPSKIDSSYVVNKLDGTQTVGDRMPLGGSLSTDKIQLIKRWITAGAPNN
jgi:hypothetical protein